MRFYRVYWRSLTLYLLLQAVEPQGSIIKNLQLEKCVHVNQYSGRVSVAKCKLHSEHQQWFWNPERSLIVNVKSNQCLTVSETEDFSQVKMAACDGDERQIWTCDKMGHLTLLGHRLYLSAKPESKKVFVSKGNDKFSKWKTTLNVPICKGRIPATEHGEPIRTQEMDVTQHVIEETKPGARTFTASPGKTNFSTWSPGTNLTFSSTESQRVYVTPNGRNNQLFFSKKENVFETQYQYQQGGSNWKMAMLVLSPFTFILGMVILVLNIRVNKRRKLESLSHRPKSVHDRFSTYEPCPGTEKGETAGQDPNSSTSRHGEILIEWKDGTIAPLYDQPMN